MFKYKMLGLFIIRINCSLLNLALYHSSEHLKPVDHRSEVPHKHNIK